MEGYQDSFPGVGHVQVSALDDVQDAVQLPLDLLQFSLDGSQLLPLLPGHVVHLLVHQSHQVVADVGLGEDVAPDAAIPNRSLPYPNRPSMRTELCYVD